MKKFTYLALALLVPGLIFVFLKYAGSNRFDIPIYYEDGVTEGAPCVERSDAPYVLPDSVRKFITPGKGGYVVIFPETGVAPLVIEALLTNEIGQGFTVADANVLSRDSTQLRRWRECIFIVTPPWQTVLFDPQGRIRGYYDLHKRDEMDRLRLELKILLEKY